MGEVAEYRDGNYLLPYTAFRGKTITQKIKIKRTLCLTVIWPRCRPDCLSDFSERGPQYVFNQFCRGFARRHCGKQRFS
jgi:hypothetical protein